MAHLGSVRGNGRVVVDGEDIGGAVYEISVTQRGSYLKEARGFLTAADENILWTVFKQGGGTDSPCLPKFAAAQDYLKHSFRVHLLKQVSAESAR